MSGGVVPMRQSPLLDCPSFQALPSVDDRLSSPEVDVGGGEVGEALVVAPAVVVIDEGADLRLQITPQVVVLKQDAVLQGLMPALDLPLGRGMVRCAANVVNTLVLEPDSKIAGDVGGAVVAEQSWFVNDPGPVTARGAEQPRRQCIVPEPCPPSLRHRGPGPRGRSRDATGKAPCG